MPKEQFRADVMTFDRKTFLTEVWDYLPGDHVTVLAPTGGGKTQLAFELLGVTANKELPATVFVMKSRDKTISKFVVKYKFRIVRDWPPGFIKNKVYTPPGWALWPLETDNPDLDDARHEAIFRKAIRDNYKRGNRILFADETYSLENELGLSTDLRRVWTKGRSMGCGLWAASQRPVWISRWALQAQHLFLANDPDVAMQKRYGEIGGGIDPDAVRYTVSRLKRFEFVYINREERAMCIVQAQ